LGIMIWKLIAVFLIGGIVGLDTTAAWQMLFSHPLISCPSVGWLFGDLQTGLFMGLILELLWLKDLPVGGARFPEGNIGSLVTTFLAITLKQNTTFPEGWIVLVVLIFGVMVAYGGSQSIALMRTNNIILIRKADRFADQGKSRKVACMHLLGVLHAFIHGALLTTMSVGMGLVLLPPLLNILPTNITIPLQNIKLSLLAVGFGVMAYFFLSRRNWIYLIFGIGIGGFLALTI